MRKQELTKLIKPFLHDLCREYGFVLHSRTLITKVNANVLQIINFDILAEGFNCSIALQPLYYPAEEISLSFGNRLTTFKTMRPGIWGYGNEKETVRDLQEVAGLLQKNAIPWLSKTASPGSIIDFIRSGKADNDRYIIGCPPVWKLIYHAYSLVFEGSYAESKAYLNQALSWVGNRPWEEIIRHNINEMILMTDSQKYQDIECKIKENISFSREAMKLK